MNIKITLLISFLFGIVGFNKAQTISTQDSLALIAFADTTQGYVAGGWNTLLSPSQQWIGTNSVAQWYGVSTTIIGPNRRVTALDLSGVGLQGNFPNHIFNGSQLEELVRLDLGTNQLGAQVDTSIFSNLAKLEELYLQDNLLEGIFPTPLSSVYNLEYLQKIDISNNNFEGVLQLDWLLGKQISTSINGGNSAPIKELLCAGNNFQDITITGTTALFDSLEYVYVNNNEFHFDDLHTLVVGLKMSQILGEHYVPLNAPMDGLNPDTLAFLYAPQGDAGIGGVRRKPDGDVYFYAEIGEPTSAGIYNSLDWSRQQGALTEVLGTVDFAGALPILSNLGLHTASLGSIVPAPNDDRQAVLLDSIDASHHDWLYKACATNDSFPLLEICMLPKKLIVAPCYDDLGNEITCQQFMVQYEEDATEEEKEALRKEFGITLLDSCMCGSIELWGMPDTLNAIDVEQNGRGTRRSTGQAKSRPNMLGSDSEYELLSIAPISTGDTTPGNPIGTAHPNPTLIAIIDSGTDYDHPSLTDRIWINPDDSPNGLDDDANCVADDSWGYNFMEYTGIPYDDHGHGSAIAGVIAGQSTPNSLPNTSNYDSLAILPIKFTNRELKGTLFNATCAVRYAAEYHNMTGGHKVRVINASWGYYGEPATILKETIRYAGEQCGLLFVCSAGNDAVDLDTIGHYPSNYDLENILVVASTDKFLLMDDSILAGYSNFGDTMVDIATWGDYNSTGSFPSGLGGVEVINGTSFATAQVSRAAGLLFHAHPESSYRAVKRALMQGVDFLNSPDSAKLVSGGKLNYTNSLAILASDSERQNCMPEVSMSLYLEGALDTITGLMRDDLYTNGHLPSTQPFNVAPWFYNGGESLTATFLGIATPVDWILMSVCTGSSCVYKAAILLRDGNVIDADGTALDFPAIASNSCILQIIPYNHLASISTQEITLTHPSSNLNLSGILTNVKMMSTWEVLPAGDSNGDGQVNPVDKNGYWRVDFGQNGYKKGDYNLDGTVDNTDYPFWLNNQSLESSCDKCRKATN